MQGPSALQSLTVTLLTFWLLLIVEGENCDSNICFNGGSCFTSANKEPFCICLDGFTGAYCNITEKGPCQPNPCYNNGECQVLPHSRRGDTFAQYACKCLPGYDGDKCENSLGNSKCYGHPIYCTKFPEETSRLNLPRHSFPSLGDERDLRYSVVYKSCAHDRNRCSSGPCKNGGICSHLEDDYSCQCASPYIGKSCQVRCANALGMEGGAISDAQITSSSLYHGFLGLQRWGPNLARLNNKGLVNAWTANSYDRHPWIQVNLLRQVKVSGILTQGASRMGNAEYLKEFKVAYSVDGHEFTVYKGDGQEKDKIFRGNLDNENRKANIFSPPFSAQYIRIYPVTCHRACTLRFELFGCELNGCSAPLGMKSHLISDKQITASSVFKTWGIDAFTWHPHYARLDKIGKSNAWTALENDQSEWLQIDLWIPKKITGIVTQGAKDFGNIQYVEAFKVAYSDNGSAWIVYQDSRTKTDKVFLGNNDNYSHKKNIFSPPFTARYVRILPQSWHERITLRMELLGCDN